MAKLAGCRLEDMADIRLTRKKKIVNLCTLTAFFMFAYYSFDNFNHSYPWLGLFNGLCAVVCLANYIYIYSSKHPLYADLLLSCVLLVDGLVLFLYGDLMSGRVMWLFPILATVILINEFKVGLIFSGAFAAMIGSSLLMAESFTLPSQFNTERFLLTLLTTAVVCHTSSYFYAKVVNYIQTLYQEGIEDLAYSDQLTGLANRWSFENWAKDKLEEIDQLPTTSVTALVFLDIDNFKSINDTYGHDVGDRVLQHFAKRLKNNIRNKDRRTDRYDYSIARFAGDEFVLMLYDVRTKQDLDKILQRIVGLFSSGYDVNERISELTLSVGVAIYQQDAKDISELTRCADKAMYAAKHSGKNQYAYYESCHQTIAALRERNAKMPIISANVHSIKIHQKR